MAVVRAAIEEAEDRSRMLVEALGESTDLARDLRGFARQHVEVVTQPGPGADASHGPSGSRAVPRTCSDLAPARPPPSPPNPEGTGGPDATEETVEMTR